MSVVLKGVTVEIAGRVILSRISCTFGESSITALIGPSGTGKTSLLGIIGGLIVPKEGTVEVYGQLPCAASSVWVPQGANALGARTLVDNVRIAALSDGLDDKSATRLAEEKLCLVGLASRAQSIAMDLSGGELQRLAIARALASDRPVMLVDEPTANLDHITSTGIIEVFRSIKADRTIVMATHDPDLVKAADKVVDVRLLDQRVHLDGPH